ncbi:MAG: hypothetical protein RIQ89_1074 [Bacteroidota bacterium]|jgi:hypothetical protein
MEIGEEAPRFFCTNFFNEKSRSKIRAAFLISSNINYFLIFIDLVTTPASVVIWIL